MEDLKKIRIEMESMKKGWQFMNQIMKINLKIQDQMLPPKFVLQVYQKTMNKRMSSMA